MELPQGTRTAIIACLAILGALLSLWSQCRQPTVKFDPAPIIATYTGMGEVLAEEAAKAIHDRGRIVLVTDLDPERSDRGRDDRWEAFQRELKKHGAITIAATEIVPYDPKDGVTPGCSRTAFQTLLERHANVDAFVFFNDLPDWPTVESLIPRPVATKIIAVDNLGQRTKLRYGGFFSSGILLALVSTRSQPLPASPSQPKTPREWFDKTYQVYAPQNYEALPE